MVEKFGNLDRLVGAFPYFEIKNACIYSRKINTKKAPTPLLYGCSKLFPCQRWDDTNCTSPFPLEWRLS